MVNEAIILIAGMGTRLKPLTLHNHKCLTEVNGIPILENSLKLLAKIGCKKVILVVGYLKEQVKQRIGNEFNGLDIIYAENNEYASTNTSASLKYGLDEISITDELLILEGDVFFEGAILDQLLEERGKNVTVLEKYNHNLDGTFVEMDEDFWVIDWVHKSQRPADYKITDKYKTVNIHKFTANFAKTILMENLNDSVKKYSGKEPLENVMMRIVRNNTKTIKGLVLDGKKWFEIDDIEELKIAEEIFK